MSESLSVLVLGVGNPDRGDDGVGAQVVEALRGRVPPAVALQTCSADLLSQVAGWRGVQILICVDAAASVGAPGRIHRIDPRRDTLPPDASPASSHVFGLAAAIALAQTLGVAPPKILVYAVEGRNFESGAAISADVAAAVPELVERVMADISRIGLTSGAGGNAASA